MKVSQGLLVPSSSSDGHLTPFKTEAHREPETRTGLPWGAGTLQGEEGLGRARGKREESVSWAVPHTAPTGQTDTCPCAFRGTLLDRGQSLPASSLGTLRWFSDESLREAGYGMAVTIRVARRVIPAERVIV